MWFLRKRRDITAVAMYAGINTISRQSLLSDAFVCLAGGPIVMDLKGSVSFRLARMDLCAGSVCRRNLDSLSVLLASVTKITVDRYPRT